MNIAVLFGIFSVVVKKISSTDCNNNQFNWKNAYLPGFVMDVIAPCGRIMCIQECKKNSLCLSVNHFKSKFECQLNSAIALTESELVASDDGRYIDMMKANMTTYSCNENACLNNEICTTTKNRGVKCIATKCSSVIIRDGIEHSISNQSFGAQVDIQCANRSDELIVTGYYRHICKTNGTWSLEDNCQVICPGSGYVDVPNFGVKVKVCTHPMSWFAASASCEAENATLITIYNETFYNASVDVILPFVTGIGPINASCGSSAKVLWTGANDLEEEGIFKWNNGEVLSEWHKSKLNMDNYSCDKAPQADCMQMNINSHQWHDRNCYAVQAFVCQK